MISKDILSALDSLDEANPYASFLEVEITLDSTLLGGTGVLELDGPSTSLIS